jgi:hypothetical protein
MFGNKKCSTWSKQPENTEDGIRTGYIWGFLGFLIINKDIKNIYNMQPSDQ